MNCKSGMFNPNKTWIIMNSRWQQYASYRLNSKKKKKKKRGVEEDKAEMTSKWKLSPMRQQRAKFVKNLQKSVRQDEDVRLSFKDSYMWQSLLCEKAEQVGYFLIFSYFSFLSGFLLSIMTFDRTLSKCCQS